PRFQSSIPSSLHMESTFCLVAWSITILFGHSRVNPSSFHFRVAAIPSFEPKRNARLEWSSTSIGPIVKRTSRSGSMWFSATHHASRGSCTFTSWSKTMITLASDISPCPHRPFITLYAWPGYCLSMLTNRSEEHTSELQSRVDLVCRLLLEKKKANSEHD